MDFTVFEKNYWQYYLRLEEEFMATYKYVEFSEMNSKTYSLEYLKLFQTVCSEIDVLGKKMAEELTPQKETKLSNINKWWYVLQDMIEIKIEETTTPIGTCTVRINDEYDLSPWKDFRVETYMDINKHQRYRLERQSNSTTPSWWTAYNKVKHHRTDYNENNIMNYTKANLGNLSNAYAALYLLEIGFAQRIGKSSDYDSLEKSNLFNGERINLSLSWGMF